MPIGHNRVLGDAKLASENRPHRLAMANWPASVKDPRTETLDAYLNFLAVNGYQGTEFGIGSFARYFPGQSHAAIASQVRRRLEQAGLQNFGATLHTGDDAMRALGWLTGQKDQMKLIQDTGGEFVSYQINLHPGYLHTGGAYREDEEYLKFCADRASELRAAAWEQGMNFYLEVHVDRITDDPAATCRILQLATCELNGDLSHLLSRGITQGKYVDTMLKHMGHTHVRMSRMYGDLSAVVDDPAADWANKGVTWQIFQLMKGGLADGLSSRTVSGETGPAFLVTDTLSQEARLVPLYRAMCRFADAAAQGITMPVDDPTQLKPWG